MLLLCILVLSGCCFHSEWYAATCKAPKTCVKCGETEGEALGHSWVDATCETPNTCSVCRLTEGEALGHNWVDATTEAPKTCTVCAATEGERIITDPRFTTAATRDIQGKWIGEFWFFPYDLGLGNLDTYVSLHISLDLASDGTMTVDYAIANEDEINAALAEEMAELLYAELARLGCDQAAADEKSLEGFGMTVSDYAASLAEAQTQELIDTINALHFSYVYYAEGSTLYTSNSWDGEFISDVFQLEDGSLYLPDRISETSGWPAFFTRVTE